MRLALVTGDKNGSGGAHGLEVAAQREQSAAIRFGHQCPP
jgi:hypothetical protein